MAPARSLLGQMLVDSRLITEEQLAHALERQKSDPRRLGALLVEAGLLDETQLTQALSRQLNAPWVSLYHVTFSRQLLHLVPRELAEQYTVIPVYVRKLPRHGATLYVAMEDPASEAALAACAQASGLPVRAMIAPPSDIRNAIRVYYGSGPEPVVSVPPPVEVEPEPTTTASSPPPTSTGSEDGPEIAVSEVPLPPRVRGKAKMVRLTLLDGTVIALPATRRKRRRDPDEAPPTSTHRTWTSDTELTARDLVAALRAISHGADASEILGASNHHWEAMFAALLSVLLRKHLIADWEFIEEFKKI